MNTRPLYCIVASIADAASAKPDLGCYSPKELASKENVSTTRVYQWLKAGLPAMRQGDLGNFRIYYQDYVQWMIECARQPDCKVKDVPVWAFWFVRSAGWKSPVLGRK